MSREALNSPTLRNPETRDLERHKETFRQCYLEDGLTLRQIQKKFKEDGYDVAVERWESRRRQWGFKKRGSNYDRPSSSQTKISSDESCRASKELSHTASGNNQEYERPSQEGPNTFVDPTHFYDLSSAQGHFSDWNSSMPYYHEDPQHNNYDQTQFQIGPLGTTVAMEEENKQATSSAIYSSDLGLANPYATPIHNEQGRPIYQSPYHSLPDDHS